MALSAGFWLVLVPALIPHILFVLFTVLAYVKWKKKDSISWKAAFVGGVVGTIVLIIAGGVGVYATVTAGPDPLFIAPLAFALIVGIPLAFLLLGSIWSSCLLYSCISNKKAVSTKIISLAKIILIISILLFIFMVTAIVRSYS